jgi:hypothetical protein
MYHHELIVGQLDSMMFRGCVVLIQLHCSLLMVYEYEMCYANAFMICLFSSLQTNHLNISMIH